MCHCVNGRYAEEEGELRVGEAAADGIWFKCCNSLVESGWREKAPRLAVFFGSRANIPAAHMPCFPEVNSDHARSGQLEGQPGSTCLICVIQGFKILQHFFFLCTIRDF